MTRDGSQQSRRRFLRSTATAALTATVAASSGLAGCSALPGSGDEESNPPDYNERAAEAVVRDSFPHPPAVFPVDIPDASFQNHESRARDLLDAVPGTPDIPNEAIAERIARERSDLAERLGEMERTHTPRDRLGRWRYYRDHAAEVWGSYVAATHQYSAADFQNRYDRLRSQYNRFQGSWEYHGTEASDALVVHAAIEELITRGRDDVLATGPFPNDPQSAVFEAGRMVRAHERAAANLEDARTFQNRYLADPPSSQTHRLSFAAASEQLQEDVRFQRPREPYQSAIENGRSALEADVGHGPAGVAFEHARRTARFADEAVQAALDQNDPATATLNAAHYRQANQTFRVVVDAIHADEITWPTDVAGLRQLRNSTLQALETAWKTTPQPLGIELTTHATGVLRSLHAYHGEGDVDDRDLAEFVGTLHYANRYASGIPSLTQTVVDAITTS